MDLCVLPSIAPRLWMTFSGNCLLLVSFQDNTSSFHSQYQASSTLQSAVLCPEGQKTRGVGGQEWYQVKGLLNPDNFALTNFLLPGFVSDLATWT